MRRVLRMPEEIEKPLMPFYLSLEEKMYSRPLYEAAFPEDTRKFVDYYYQYKIRDNEILALERDGGLASMLHLNPYTMIVNGYEVRINYIVAVATYADYRHRGYMRLLLERALRDMALRRMPFTFLMPAREGIYAPFDFVWICPHTELPKRVEAMDSDSQNRYLASRYQMFCKRDERYMENQKAERRSEEGEAAEGKLPPYMARITDVCQMLRLVNSFREQVLYLHIRDSIIESNNGYFRWEVSREAGKVQRLTGAPKRTDLDLTVGELASMIFEGFRICLSELV